MNTKIKFMLIGVIILFAYTSVFSQTRVLDIPRHTHPSGSDWCWAGCVKMATEYYGNNTPLCDIVQYKCVYLSPPRVCYCCSNPSSCYGPIGITQIGRVLGNEGINSSYVDDGVLSLNSLQMIINDNRPVIIQGHHNPSGGWHTMIVIGYDDTNLVYNDPADGSGSYITSYNDAITSDCMGLHDWRWQDYCHILTDQPCPVDLNLTEDIDTDANIVAQNNITLSCEIGNNREIILTAGNQIAFNSGFELPVGSTLEAKIESNPCQ